MRGEVQTGVRPANLQSGTAERYQPKTVPSLVGPPCFGCINIYNSALKSSETVIIIIIIIIIELLLLFTIKNQNLTINNYFSKV